MKKHILLLIMVVFALTVSACNGKQDVPVAETVEAETTEAEPVAQETEVQENEEDEDSVIEQANTALMEKEYDRAIRLYQEILDEDCRDKTALEGLVNASILHLANLDAQGESAQCAAVSKEIFRYVYAYENNLSPQDVDPEKLSEELEDSIIANGTLDSGAETNEMSFSFSVSEDDGIDPDWDGISLFNGHSDQKESQTLSPYDTCPPWVRIETEAEDGGVVLQVIIDPHQETANRVYFRQVDEWLAQGIDPNELTWDTYCSLEWLEDDWMQEEEVEPTEPEEASDDESTEDEKAKQESTPAPTGDHVITEEEFTYRVLFTARSPIPDVSNDYTAQVLAAVDAYLSDNGTGLTREDSMNLLGRQYPARFDEDAQAVGEGIAMDIMTMCLDWENSMGGEGKHYAIYMVQKFDNGYVFTYGVER